MSAPEATAIRKAGNHLRDIQTICLCLHHLVVQNTEQRIGDDEVFAALMHLPDAINRLAFEASRELGQAPHYDPSEEDEEPEPAA